MKRRGFLGSLVTMVAGTALAGKTADPPVRLQIIDADESDVLSAKMKSKYLASGMMPETGEEVYVSPDGKSRFLVSG